MKWREFKALGTDIIFFLPNSQNSEGIFVTAEAEIKEFENRFSRFIPNNELAIFNNSLAEKFPVSKTMLGLLSSMRYYYIKTKGIFDPTVISSLESLGYNRNFIDLESDSKPTIISPEQLEKTRKQFIERIKMEALKIEEPQVIRPFGLKLDFGGIGKSYIVNQLALGIFSGVNDFLISAGGDILAAGNQVGQLGWDVAVQNPTGPEAVPFFINTLGQRLGIATSGISERTWGQDNSKFHHIIDPRSGLSADNDIISVTVISDDIIKSDVYAKTVLIMGVEEGLEFIDSEQDTACLIFIKNGKTIFSKQVKHYLKDKQ